MISMIDHQPSWGIGHKPVKVSRPAKVGNARLTIFAFINDVPTKVSDAIEIFNVDQDLEVNRSQSRQLMQQAH